MFMTSAGGLTAAELFQGKDAILSGPAGGVVGMAETGREAGFQQLIGFDMGGTSTDVSHYDGELERAFETEIAGVRMRAPMMLIHTVAAGGGSILHFDGARFRVGPDSAGADPGPKCYQRGYNVTRYVLHCFGGAGGQHACLVADALGMTKVLVHPFSSLLSAYGMGLADIRATRQQAIEEAFGRPALEAVVKLGRRLGDD